MVHDPSEAGPQVESNWHNEMLLAKSEYDL